MNTSYLLHNKYKWIGWVLLAMGLVLGGIVYANDYEMDALSLKVIAIYNEEMFSKYDGFFKIIENSIFDEIAAVLIIFGGLLIGFTKEKIEDEFIYKLRKDSLVWALLFNYSVLVVAICFVYGFTFFDVLVFNMFTPLMVFIIRFNFLKRIANHD